MCIATVSVYVYIYTRTEVNDLHNERPYPIGEHAFAW